MWENHYHTFTVLIMIVPCGQEALPGWRCALEEMEIPARIHKPRGISFPRSRFPDFQSMRQLQGEIPRFPIHAAAPRRDSQVSSPWGSSKERFPDFQFMQQLCAEMMCQGWDLPGDCSQNEPLCQRPLPAGGDMCNTLHLFARGWLKIKWIFSIMQPLLAAVH